MAKLFRLNGIIGSVFIVFGDCSAKSHKNGELYRLWEGYLASRGPKLYQLVAGYHSS